jgi:hypothetical protein
MHAKYFGNISKKDFKLELIKRIDKEKTARENIGTKII